MFCHQHLLVLGSDGKPHSNPGVWRHVERRKREKEKKRKEKGKKSKVEKKEKKRRKGEREKRSSDGILCASLAFV